MSCSITSLKGDHVGGYLGAMIGVTKGDTGETFKAKPCCWLLGTAEACVVCRV